MPAFLPPAPAPSTPPACRSAGAGGCSWPVRPSSVPPPPPPSGGTVVPPPPPPPLREPARRRRWPRWVALAAGVVLVVVGALALVSTATRSSTPRGTTVPLDGVARRAVTTRAGNVTILSEERGDIGVEAELTSTWIADADLDVTDQGGTLRVDGRCGGLVV